MKEWSRDENSGVQSIMRRSKKTNLFRGDFGGGKKTYPYLLRGDATQHVVGAVEGVGQGVFVRCLVQLLDNTCMTRHLKDHFTFIEFKILLFF